MRVRVGVESDSCACERLTGVCEALNGSHGSSCRHCVYTYTRYGRYGWLLKTAARVVCAVFVCRSADSRRPVRARRGAIVDSLFILIPEYIGTYARFGGFKRRVSDANSDDIMT